MDALIFGAKLILRPFRGLKALFAQLFLYPSYQQGDVCYDQYWQAKQGQHIGKLSAFRLERASIVAEYVEPQSFVVDVGCGDGAVLSYLRQQKDLRCLGVDCSQHALEVLAAQNIDLLKCDITDREALSLLPEADVYLALELLEHLANSELVLTELLSRSADKLIFSVPNSGYILHRLRLLLGRFPRQWVRYPGEHLRFWTLCDVRWWLAQLGYKKAQVRCYQGVRFLNRLWPALFAAGIIVVIKKEKTAN